MFDNHLAREQWQITPMMKGKFAHWAKTKLPQTSFKKTIWKNELKHVNLIKTSNEVHAREEFLYFSAIAARWLRNYEESREETFDPSTMSKNTPPQWLCDKLQIGGLSKIEARVQATSITKIVRQGMINNWMKRQSLIIRDPQKLVIPKQATHSSFSQWGKHVKQATTVPPPATTQNNPNAPKFTNKKQQLKMVRKEKQDTNSPSKSKGKTLELPKNLRGKTLEKTIQQET